MGDDWVATVKSLHQLLFEGDDIYRMMQVTGEEGISLEDYMKWQKSVLLDMVYLQQDAFDPIDASMPRQRQAESLRFLKGLIDNNYDFTERDSAREFFTRLTSLYKNWNYSAPDTAGYERYREAIENLVAEHTAFVESRSSERSPAT